MEGAEKQEARLVFREVDYHRLRTHLLKSDGLERAAFLLLGERADGGFRDLYVHKMILPSDRDYCLQSRTVVELRPEYVLETFDGLVKSGVPGLLHAHSHPFTANAAFSSVDDGSFPGMQRSLHNYLLLTENGDRSHSFSRLVWGRQETGFTAEFADGIAASPLRIREVRVVGKSGIRVLADSQSQIGEPQEPRPVSGQFRRQVDFLGEAGQRSIENTRLAVCGVGGLGSFVVASAKGLGFRDITLIDPDYLEEHNLNRYQGADLADVGRPKVEVVADALHRFDPGIHVHAVQGGVEEPTARAAIGTADLIISALDNEISRMEVQMLAALYLKPLIDLGAGIMLHEGRRTVRAMGGQAILYAPGEPCLLCQGLNLTKATSSLMREVHRATGYVAGTNETPASVVTHNAVIAGLGLQMAIDYITGFAATPSYIEFDLLNNSIKQHRFARRPGCPVCGQEGIEGRGDDSECALPAAAVREPLPPAFGDAGRPEDWERVAGAAGEG